MSRFKGLKSMVVVAAALAVPVLTNGCSAANDIQSAACCTEFAPGATIDVKIGGSAQSQVAAQALADISGIASASIDDLTSACRGIAQDLDAAQADADAAEANADKNAKMKAWCALAVKQIGTIKGQIGGSITLNVTPPVCEASVSAKLDCQAKCTGSAKCDVKANPPTCTGGSLTVDCKGGCTANAGATLSCTGTCSGSCSGSCTAQGGVAVDCNGKCDGTCAAGGSASGGGIQADGTCKGTCSGTCTATATAPALKCTGSCNGKCDATCQGSATASVKCDGKCDADYTPLSCTGGKLEGGCTVDAKCDANCNGSVQAKATCTPPSIDVAFAASANIAFADKLEATLKVNLPKILELKVRFAAMADATASLTGNIQAVADVKAACIPPMIAAAAQAVTNIGDSVSAVGSVSGSIQ